jgi:hypothetical protein
LFYFVKDFIVQTLLALSTSMKKSSFLLLFCLSALLHAQVPDDYEFCTKTNYPLPGFRCAKDE